MIIFLFLILKQIGIFLRLHLIALSVYIFDMDKIQYFHASDI